jgi:uncharacterized protein
MVLEDIVIGRSPSDTKKYGKAGCGFIGKHVVGSGFESHITNPVLTDLTSPHIILIVGKRGSGKSYTGAVLAEEIMNLPENVNKNLSCVMIDTMGIYWSMKNPNDEALLLLKDWKMKPKGFETRNIVPIGLQELYRKKGVPFDETFSLRPSELTPDDWRLAFGFNVHSTVSILLERIVRNLSGEYTLQDMIDATQHDKKSLPIDRLILEGNLTNAQRWGIFSSESTPIENFISAGKAVVLDISLQEWKVRNLLVGLLSRKIYEARTRARRLEEMERISGRNKMKIPMVWLIMDEAHNFLPNGKKTAATDPLLTLVKQGRQPGISCVFITQRPNKLHEDAISQADMVISHRLTSKPDLDALSAIMQTYLLEDIKKSISRLPKSKGSAVVLDDNSERLFTIQIRPRESWHAGGTPVALSDK